MTLRSVAILAGIALGLLVSYGGSARAGATYSTPTTTACSSRSVECAAGTCTETAPTTNSGFALANVQGYVVRIQADSGQTLSGAGTMRVYHCSALLSPACAEIPGNAQAVTASGVRPMEFPPFVVPYLDNTADTMYWSPSGVTVSSGNLTVYICPQS
jgi:hypothetical protein